MISLFWTPRTRVYEIESDGILLAYLKVRNPAEFSPERVNYLVEYFKWSDEQFAKRGRGTIATRLESVPGLLDAGNAGDDVAPDDWHQAVRSSFAAYKRKGPAEGPERGAAGRVSVLKAIGVREGNQASRSVRKRAGRGKLVVRELHSIVDPGEQADAYDSDRFEKVHRSSLNAWELENEKSRPSADDLMSIIDQGQSLALETYKDNRDI